MACKRLSKGWKIWYDSNGADPYTQLTGVKTISHSGIKNEMKDQTDLDSDEDFREFCKSFKDGGQMSLGLYFDDDVADVVYNTLDASDEPYYYRITAPLKSGQTNPSKLEFQAHVEEVPLEIPENDNVMNDVSFKITGPVVYTKGS